VGSSSGKAVHSAAKSGKSTSSHGAKVPAAKQSSKKAKTGGIPLPGAGIQGTNGPSSGSTSSYGGVY
jgi:hypothetical protein